ncbi:hypothetical protein [Catenulispora rubra]|nr:hypothetical protein [Catenulispora rubra]
MTAARFLRGRTEAVEYVSHSPGIEIRPGIYIAARGRRSLIN